MKSSRAEAKKVISVAVAGEGMIPSEADGCMR